jgi:hypothetical protein
MHNRNPNPDNQQSKDKNYSEEVMRKLIESDNNLFSQYTRARLNSGEEDHDVLFALYLSRVMTDEGYKDRYNTTRRRLEEENALLIKPQPKSNGNYGGIEI